jgi:hypothetical protein
LLILTIWSIVAPTAVSAGLQIRKRLCRLRAKISGIADELAVTIEAELAGDVDDATGAGDLDHVAVAGRLGDGGRIEEADVVDQLDLLG